MRWLFGIQRERRRDYRKREVYARQAAIERQLLILRAEASVRQR